MGGLCVSSSQMSVSPAETECTEDVNCLDMFFKYAPCCIDNFMYTVVTRECHTFRCSDFNGF